MKKIKNPSDKLIREILSLRNSRKSLDDYTFNFLLNYGDHCRLIHFLLTKINKKKDEDIYNAAYRQYFVFLVSSWETFFRDLFVYVYAKDQESIKKLLENINHSEQTEMQDISSSELLSKCFNFQNLEDIEHAYNAMWGNNFLKTICEKEIKDIGIDGRIAKDFSLNTLFPDWHVLLQQAFSIRHNIVHDANYRIEPDKNFVQKVEVIFLLIPQLASYSIANKYNFKRVVMSNGEYAVPYIFSIKDILSSDWYIV